MGAGRFEFHSQHAVDYAGIHRRRKRRVRKDWATIWVGWAKQSPSASLTITKVSATSTLAAYEELSVGILLKPLVLGPAAPNLLLLQLD